MILSKNITILSESMREEKIEMSEVEYKISLYPSKFKAYSGKKGKNGYVKLFISNIWEEADKDFDLLVMRMICYTLLERICLERAFNKIRIKGGKCNPCCVKKYALEMYRFVLENWW